LLPVNQDIPDLPLVSHAAKNEMSWRKLADPRRYLEITRECHLLCGDNYFLLLFDASA